MDTKSEEIVDVLKKGHTTREALDKLYHELSETVRSEEKKQLLNKSWLYSIFVNRGDNFGSSGNQVPLFRLTSAITLLLCCISYLVSYLSHKSLSYSNLPYETLIIATLVAANMLLTRWDLKLRADEFPLRAKWLLNLLEDCKETCKWEPENYPHILSPLSPSITLQLTVRDGVLVNLPWALLVKDDIILLRPGQIAPGKCQTVQHEPSIDLVGGQVYSPPVEGVGESFHKPELRKPSSAIYCVMEETPYVESLRICLQEATKRPAGIFSKEKHTLFSLCFEYVIVPVILVGLAAFNAMRYLYASRWLSAGHWTEMLLLQPFAAVLPLLPLMLPIVWLVVNAGGMAWILALFYTARQFKVSSDPFEEAEVTSPTHASLFVKLKEMKHHFCGILQSRGKSPFRTENLVQTLASVTALCCVDKKGILSWPNPTAEKVFFLRSSTTTESPIMSSAEEETSSEQSANATRKRRRRRQCSEGETIAEVLDLSHEYSSPFRLQFDDPGWQNYMNSLKPLGLSILLNTCKEETQEKYAHFCAHLSCHSLHHEDLVPVTNRRLLGMMHAGESAHFNDAVVIKPSLIQTPGCLCELAKQIGFQDGAEEIFSLKDLFFTFRHQADMARKDRLARSLAYPKLKFPFPHMVGVAVQEAISGGMQLMSQGTGEILLDACVDFWDGNDLKPLNVADRKKILDFYHRTSLTAYCTAFAYSPLRTTLYNTFRNSSSGYSDCYLELPADSGHLYQPQRSPTISVQWDSTQQPLGHVQQHSFISRSSESLQCPPGPADEENDPAEAIFRLQCNQTFVAMVTMQYQARTDMVQLIEQLDKACIRFVHFSKENELRSRVFSEKMGLESGWNCHISLLGDASLTKEQKEENDANRRRLKTSQTSVKAKEDPDTTAGKSGTLERHRPLSVSAPSAINVEVAQVKFEDEISLHSLSINESESSASANAENQGLLRGVKKSGTGTAAPTPSPCRRTSSSTECSLNTNSSSSVLLHVSEGFGEGGSSYWDVNLSRSQSHVTESTEQSAPVAFDMSNRAKLPRGIEEIRPHIESVDNVPLLVSLFTDCTPGATREMIQIMQDYGEVVCVVGSSASAHNTAIFMQADASLAVEPLYPQVCQKIPAFSTTGHECPTPAELSRRMNSLPCSLSFRRDELASLLHLILESRHFGLCLRNMMQFWAAAAASLALLQVLSALLFLPPILTTGQVLWISSVTIPLLAISLFGAPTDPHIMSLATGKNQQHFDRETVVFVLWSYGLKFLPSLTVLLLTYALTLGQLCGRINPFCGSTAACFWVYPVHNNQIINSTWAGWDSRSNLPFLSLIRGWISLVFVLYLIFVSMTFVHRMDHFWKRNPFENKLWSITSAILFVTQAVHFIVVAVAESGTMAKNCAQLLTLTDLPVSVWCIAALWPFILVPFNEFIKHQEMKVHVRLQKRARLEFGTKLGMNSPF